MPHVEVLGDANQRGSGVLLENYGQGTKWTAATTAARLGPFANCGSVEVMNDTGVRVWCRTDDSTATDDGTARMIPPGATWISGIQSSDGTISIVAEAVEADADALVWIMGLKGSR